MEKEEQVQGQEQEQEYDFISMGVRDARDLFFNLRERAKTIEKNYGIDARLAYESGISMVVPVYGNFSKEEQKVQDKELNHTTSGSSLGVDNTRNLSYFGGSGTGVQYTTNASGTKEYNHR